MEISVTKSMQLEVDAKRHDQTYRALRYRTSRGMRSHVLQHITWLVDDGGLRLLTETIPRKGRKQ